MPHSSETKTTHTTDQHPLTKPYWKHSSPLITFLTQNLMKSLILICIVTLISLCYFSSYPISKFVNCPECDRTLIHTFNNHLHSLKTKTNKLSPSQPPPPKARTNASHILFGIGGSSGTWARRRHYTELWFKPNTTRGYVWLDIEPPRDEPWPYATSPPYKISSDTSGFKYTNQYGSRSAIRIARIVKESFELGLSGVRWFVMGDDDTVFFVENLLTVLNKYDHREMYYVGSVSESVEQALVHSYGMGYGGGGFAISYALAEALVKILDGCIDRYADMYGSDQKVGSCVNEIGVPLTKEEGFHQVDIRGSPYGLLSAHPITPLVSLHHLDYIQPLFPGTSRLGSVQRLIQASKHDPSRTLQQALCYDPKRNWSVSISWGYTVQLYPFLLSAKDLSTPLQTFLTWGSWSQEPFTFNTRVMSLEPCERPIMYYYEGVEDSIDGGKRSTLTWYRRASSSLFGNRKRCEGDEGFKEAYGLLGFNVSAEVLDRGIWSKAAPRRQCCEVIDGSDRLILEVRIRGCEKYESVTPP